MATNSKSYQNGKIYVIRNQIDDDVYIGSTCQPLSKRMAYHRRDMKGYKKERKLYSKMNELGSDQFYIDLVEEYPCMNKDQLRKKEGEYIRSMGTLSSLISGRTKKEWTLEKIEHVKEVNRNYHEEHKAEHNERNKKWREEHPEEMKAYKEKWYAENKEEHLKKSKGRYEQNKEQILQRNKEYRVTHKEEIKETTAKWNIEITCPCGGKYKKAKRNEHEKTKLHQHYIEHGTPKTFKGDSIQCECGMAYRGNKPRHEQCKKHQDYIKPQTTNKL
jgi:hypothetical protein